MLKPFLMHMTAALVSASPSILISSNAALTRSASWNCVAMYAYGPTGSCLRRTRLLVLIPWDSRISLRSRPKTYETWNVTVFCSSI